MSRLKETGAAPSPCAPQTPLITVCRRSADAAWPVTRQKTRLAAFFGHFAPSGNHRRALADQIAIVVETESDDRIAFDDFGPGRIGGQCGLSVAVKLSRALRPASERAASGNSAMRWQKAACCSATRSGFRRYRRPKAYSAVSHNRLAATRRNA